MLKKSAFAIALIYTLILAIVSFISLKGVPDFNYSNTDKIFHFLAYIVLSFLWFVVFFKKIKWPFNKSLWFTVVATILFGIIIEVLQGVLTNFRSADYWDVLANSLGVGTTVVALLLLKKTVVKK